MSDLKLFVDIHNREAGTFPEKISEAEFASFYENYQQACAQEGVISIKVYSNMDNGKAFCVTLAESADAVKRAHERVGLPFDSISEVKSVSPDDLFSGVA